MEYTPQGQLHSTASPDSAYRSLALQHFAYWAIAKRESSLAMHGVMQFARVLLSCDGRAESKVPSGLVAFGRALGRIGRFSCWKVMWLAERGYTASVQYTATAAYPVGVPPAAQSQFHVDDGGFSSCILHRLAAMVLVTLDGSESASERKAHLALGLRNAFANLVVDTSRFSRAITTTTALQLKPHSSNATRYIFLL